MNRKTVSSAGVLAALIIFGFGSAVVRADSLTFDSTDTPKPVPPVGTSGITTSSIVVADDCLIEDLNVTVDINHTFDGDLVLSVGDGGPDVVLSDNRGGGGNNFKVTTFDDEAATPISSGTAPFNGSFRPESPLSSFDGSSTLGTWTLTIDDQLGGDSGTLNAWSITVDAMCGGPTHYLTYRIKAEPKFDEVDVVLTDQFQTGTFTVDKRETLLTPVDKNGEGFRDSETHLLGYKLKSGKSGKSDKFEKVKNVRVDNQFGAVIVDVEKPEDLLVPASKSLTDLGVPAPDFLTHLVNHFLCYKVKLSKGEPDFEPILGVSLVDQFESKLYDIVKPKRLCTPVDKNGEGIKIPEDPEDHLLCYEAEHAVIFVNDQFGPAALDTRTKKELCVPSIKTL